MLIGVVGKPSSGKSTFFKAATLADVEIANYPFTTIKPNHGTGFVKIDCADKEFNVQCNPRMGYCQNHNRFIPVDMLDVAGLVPGAHEGKGMGNQFLDDLNQADVLIHIIDCSGSTNANGEPVDALSHDPLKDVGFLEFELDMWYIRSIEKGWEKFARSVAQERANMIKAMAKQLSFLRVTEVIIEDTMEKLGLEHDVTKWTHETKRKFATHVRRITKPMVVACNKIDVPGAENNFNRLREAFPQSILIPCSSEAELALKEAAKHQLIDYIPGESSFSIKNESSLNEKQKKALQFIDENVLKKFKSTGVQGIINAAVFDCLKYIAIFPGGVGKMQDQYGRTLADCFLMPPNATALDFAFKLHTDIGNHFVKAIDVKTRKPVGKDYPLKHRDVIEIATSK